MRAAQLQRPAPAEQQPLHLEEVPRPEAGSGLLLLEISVCGLCHTDLHLSEGDITPPAYPVTPGHQIVGEVVEVGEGVRDWSIGERAGVSWLAWADGTCDFCRRGLENLCPRARFTGFHQDGGLAEYAVVDAEFALRLPPAMSDEEAAPLLCAGIIGYRSLRLADLEPGETLGLVGFGASAHLAIQVARHWGCEVLVFTRSPSHRRLALDLGAAWAGAAEDSAPKPLDRAVTFAPVGNLVPTILEKLRPGGTLAINAIHLTPIPEMEYDLLYGERTLRSVANLTRQDAREFLELAAEIPIHTTRSVLALDEVNKALLELKDSSVDGALVIRP